MMIGWSEAQKALPQTKASQKAPPDHSDQESILRPKRCRKYPRTKVMQKAPQTKAMEDPA